MVNHCENMAKQWQMEWNFHIDDGTAETEGNKEWECMIN